MKMMKFDTETYNSFIDGFTPITHDGVNLITSDIAQYFLAQHIDKNFIDTHNEEVPPLNAFKFLWGHFVGAYKKMLFDSYDTLQLEYNPLENYNGTIEFTHGSHKDFDTDIVGTHEGVNESESHPYGYNSDTYSNSEKVISNFKNKNYTDTYEKNYSEYTDIEKKHGNLGITTSQQMVNSQLELDQYNLVKWFFDLFAHQNLFYC